MIEPAEDDELERLVERWHKSEGDQPLHEFLGWSEEEYLAWVIDPTKKPRR